VSVSNAPYLRGACPDKWNGLVLEIVISEKETHISRPTQALIGNIMAQTLSLRTGTNLGL